MEFTNAVRAVHQVDVTFAGPPGRVFPLLCPVREYDWIEGWSCVMVFSDTGVAELGCVFRTSSDLGDEVWTVSRYEPGRAIEFVRVVADVWVAKMDIHLSPGDADPTGTDPTGTDPTQADPAQAGTTQARVRHTYTALGPRGVAAIQAMTPERHAAGVHELATMANHYLTTGRMLRRAHRRSAH